MAGKHLEFDSWTKKMCEQLSKIGPGYIWHNLSGICKNINKRCNDIE
jgi:hypothetical protein